MSQSTPEIDAILDDLTTLCCEALGADGQLDHDRVSQLVESLSTNGWKRHHEDGPSLSTVLQRRIRNHCQEPAMHRGAAVESLVAEVQKQFDKVSRYETATPNKNKDVATQSHPPRG